MGRRFAMILSAATALAVLAAPSGATNGYFSHGYGTHYKGRAGAGAALHYDVTGNPSGYRPLTAWRTD